MMWKELIAYKTPVRGLAFKEFLEIDKGMALILCLYTVHCTRHTSVQRLFLSLLCGDITSCATAPGFLGEKFLPCIKSPFL